jgi:hypothetical protein
MDERFHLSRFSDHAVSGHPRPPCAQCGATLSGPAWSEPAGEARERYLWSCRSCGYCFETLVIFTTEIRDQAA